METLQINVYSFNELSQEAKKKAISKIENDTNYIYNEAYNTVKAFNKLTGIKEGSNSWLDFNVENFDINILELKGLRLRKWILNNWGSFLYTRKFYASIGDNKIIKHPCIKVNKYDINKGARASSSNFYYSRIQLTNSSTLTGVCYDYSLLKPIYDFINNYKLIKDYNSYQNLENLISECFANLDKDIENECNYLQSEEAIIETIEANEYRFLENGEIF